VSEILPVSDASLAEMTADSLTGAVWVDAAYQQMGWPELVAIGQEMRDHEQNAQRQLLHCVRRVLEIAGDRPPTRAKALAEYGSEIGYTPGYMWQFARVALILRAEDQERYPQLTVGQFYEAALRTGLPGERADAPERRERALSVLNASADRNLTRRETARVAGEVREEALALSLTPAEVEIRAQSMPLPPPYFDQAAAQFVKEFGQRTRAHEPGTWSLIDECAREAFLNLRGAWVISPRDR
jgi:hypothetical protein